MTSHLFIPDTQIHPGVPLDHIHALANYVVEKKPNRIIMIGDWWDMPSLSVYEDKGSKYFHDKNYKDDVQYGNYAMSILMDAIEKEMRRIRKNKKKLWKPDMHFCIGNHEQRIKRAVNRDPVLEGTISYDDLDLRGWQVHDFLEIVNLDGVNYSHYFVNPDSLRGAPLSGTIENKLKLMGESFSMGHQQTRQYGTRHTATGKELHGLVCGSFYMHDEAYMGPQMNRQHWRGIVMKNEVQNGAYDPCFVSLDFLLRRYSD